MKKGLCIELTQGQYDHLYNIMCSQDEIVQYLNESDDFDVQTFDILFDNICAAKETYLSNTVKGVYNDSKIYRNSQHQYKGRSYQRLRL